MDRQTSSLTVLFLPLGRRIGNQKGKWLGENERMNARRKKIASKIELELRLAELNRLRRQLEQREELIRDMARKLNSTYQSGPRANARGRTSCFLRSRRPVAQPLPDVGRREGCLYDAA
jgi:hypothetical protein